MNEESYRGKNQIMYSYIAMPNYNYYHQDGTFLYPKPFVISYARRILESSNYSVSPQIEFGWQNDYKLLCNIFGSFEIGGDNVRWNLALGTQTVLFSTLRDTNKFSQPYTNPEHQSFYPVTADLSGFTGPTFKLLKYLLIRPQVGFTYGRQNYSDTSWDLRFIYRVSAGFEF